MEALDLEGQADNSGEEGLSGESSIAMQLTRQITNTGIKKRRVAIVDYLLLRGAEGAVGWLDPFHRKV